MNTEFKIKTLLSFDRYVFYVVKDNQITHIDYYQGIASQEHENDIVNIFLEGVNDKNPIIDIYNNLIKNMNNLDNGVQYFDELNRINYAIELYITAYDYQIINY
jgi:hypothetical protein